MRVLVVALVLWMGVGAATAEQEHKHPPQDVPIHERFYSTWMMPDHRQTSCCDQKDCYPTEVKFEYGDWWALRREDRKFVRVPPEKIEQERDNPDGRNHVCMAPPARGDIVYCLSLGGGT